MVVKQLEVLETNARPKIETLKAMIIEQRTEIERKKTEIINEYETFMPHHQADVAFGETIAQIVQESRARFESLLFRSHCQERELDTTASQIREKIQINERDPQEKASDIIESLEGIRQLIIARGIFLMQLKSTMNGAPIAHLIKFDINSEIAATTTPVDQRTKGKIQRMPLHSKSSRSSGKKNSRHVRKSKHGRDSGDSSKDIDPMTIEGQLELIRIDLMSALNTAATEYYNNLKNRKGIITRPSIIPPTHPELIDQMSKQWITDTEGFKNHCEQANIKYRYQVVDSYEIGKSCEELIFNLFGDFYKQKLIKERESLQIKFDNDLRALTNERKVNENQMGARLSDLNLTTEFREVADRERGRTERESQLIAALKKASLEIEREIMLSYVKILPVITTTLLKLFDNFLLIEDLIPGEQPLPRRTLRSLIQDKERNGNKTNISERPFHLREWGTLRVVMAPIAKLTPPPVPDPEVTGKVAGRSRRKRHGTPAPVVEQPTGEIEEMPVVSSLETQLHRSVIIERNKEYGRYEKELTKHLEDMDLYIQSLDEGTQAFTKHWMERMHSINPDIVIPAVRGSAKRSLSKMGGLGIVK
jgi:hypothetical protein